MATFRHARMEWSARSHPMVVSTKSARSLIRACTNYQPRALFNFGVSCIFHLRIFSSVGIS